MSAHAPSLVSAPASAPVSSPNLARLKATYRYSIDDTPRVVGPCLLSTYSSLLDPREGSLGSEPGPIGSRASGAGARRRYSQQTETGCSSIAALVVEDIAARPRPKSAGGPDDSESHPSSKRSPFAIGAAAEFLSYAAEITPANGTLGVLPVSRNGVGWLTTYQPPPPFASPSPRFSRVEGALANAKEALDAHRQDHPILYRCRRIADRLIVVLFCLCVCAFLAALLGSGVDPHATSHAADFSRGVQSAEDADLGQYLLSGDTGRGLGETHLRHGWSRLVSALEDVWAAERARRMAEVQHRSSMHGGGEM